MTDISKLYRRVVHAIRPAKVAAPPVESGTIQRIQVQMSELETRDLNSMQTYGFASSLKPGCDVMIINVVGDQSNGTAIASNDQRHRPKGMAAGEVKIYDDTGQYIYIKTGGVIEIKANTKVIITAPEVEVTATTKVKLTAPTTEVVGNVTVTGTITAQGHITSGSLNLSTHKHTGVQPGAGLTGLPT